MEQSYEKLADLLVRHSVSLKKGEKVLIDNTEVPENMTIALVRAVREYGGIPFVQTSQSRIGREIMLHATKEQMETFMKFSMPKIKEMDAYIAIAGSHNIYESSDVDADIKTMMSKVTKPYLDYRVNETHAMTMSVRDADGNISDVDTYDHFILLDGQDILIDYGPRA